MTRCKIIVTALIFTAVVFGTCKSDVDFTAVDQTQRYGITINPVPANGALSLSTNLAMSGELVRVYVNPDPGYMVQPNSLKFRYPKTSNATWMEMAKVNYYYQQQVVNAMEVTAVFDPVTNTSQRTVSIDRNLVNGRVFSDVTLGNAGDTVTLYDMPNSGYVLKSGSLKVFNASTGQEFTPPVTVPAMLPYTFTLPAGNVLIKAEFETGNLSRMLENARAYLQAGQYESAAEFFAQAYQKRDATVSDDDLNEVLFYHSLAKLGDILLTPTVRSLLGYSSLQLRVVPSSLDDWICDEDSGWQGDSNNKWFMNWPGLDYGGENTEGINTDKGYLIEEHNAVLWKPRPDLITEDKVLPRLEDRSGLGSTGNSQSVGGTGGWGTSFPDMPLINQNPNSPQKFANMLFWLMCITHRESGFNETLQKIEDLLFGTAFEDAASIAAQVPDGYQNVPLYPNLVNRFGLDKYYGSGDSIKAGKAELEYIFGTLRLVKAAVQFLRAYDWSIYLQPYLGDNILAGYGLDQILDHIFSVAENSDRYREYWENSGTRQRALPFFNNLLTTRTAGNLPKSRSEFSNGLAMINRSMNYWHGTGSNFSAQAKTDYAWAKNAFTQAKNAMDGQNGGNFDFPKKLPKPGGSWPAAGGGDYAVNITEFFTAGAFNLSNLFTIEAGSGRRPPAMFKIPWYKTSENGETGAYEFQLLPGSATAVTGPISNDDSFTVQGQTGSTAFGLYSFQINTGNLRQIFPRGFEQSKYSTTGNTAFLYEVFPTIPLWPERPTYFSGPGNYGNRSAKQLYGYFH